MAKNFHGASKKNRSPRMVGDLEIHQQDQPHGENGVRFSLGKVAEAIAKGRLHPMVRSWTMKTLAKRGNPKGGLARAKAILEELRTLEGFPNASRWAPDPTASEYIAGAHLTLGDGDKPPLFALGDCFTEGTLLLAEGHALVPVEKIKPGMKVWGLDRWSTVSAVAPKGTLSVDEVRLHSGAVFNLTKDHHVYVLDCREHSMLEARDSGGEAGVMMARGHDPNVRACACGQTARSEHRVRVSELRSGMMLPAPDGIPPVPAGTPWVTRISQQDTRTMRRVDAIARDVGMASCWDITTDDHRVYLAEHDVTVSQCDDLTVAFGSAVLSPVMYLAAAEAVGVNAAVVGHAYGKDKMIEHVLGAIYDQGRWWYADPSVKDLPFGECKPFTRERVYLVPSMELLCDANVCLTDRGPAAGPPPPPRRGDFVSVNAAPGQDEPDDPSWLTEAPSTLLGFCDLSGCCGVDDDIASRVARAHRAMRETRPTVDVSHRELDQRHDDALDPFLPAIPTALNPLNVPTDSMPIRPMWPTTPQPTLDLRTNTLQPAPSHQQMLDARAQQAYQAAQDARAQADAAQADAMAHAAQQRTLGDASDASDAPDAHAAMRQTINDAAAQQQQQCFEIATANASEAHQAAGIKANELINQSCFQAWADAPCPDNPLAWNIINVPPQTDYAAQELYQPWHDGLEPYSGASWEIQNSAFLQPRKDV